MKNKRIYTKILPDGTPNPAYKPGKNKPTKFLPDGTLNPAWKKRPNKPLKTLSDGTLNPAWKARKGGAKSPKKSLFTRGEFIAWDGEGEDTGREISGAREQLYTLLANSTGTEIYNPNGLTTKECLDFIAETAKKNKNKIHAIFGGSYDFNMILRDMPKEKIELISQDGNRYGADFYNYRVRYTQRKFFEICRFRDVKRKFKQDKKSGKYVPDYDLKVTIWDVWGFFQGTFLGAVEKWLGKNYVDLPLLKEGKSKRNEFAAEDKEFIKEYNAAELRALVLLLEELHLSIKKIGLTISRWDGAGAIASAMFKKHDVKAAFCIKNGRKWERVELPPEVQEAAAHAYFGGRIEVGKIGRHVGKVYHYDINSAYPSVQCELPALTCGRWRRRVYTNWYNENSLENFINSLEMMSVCLIKWNFPGAIWGAFPYRSEKQRKVLFPETGMNWVWLPEVKAAIKAIKNNPKWTVEILNCYEFQPDITCYKPYAFMREYYETRQALIKDTKETGTPHGEEKTYKVGINSAYGKTAQHAGYHPDTKLKPPFHNLAYAGYITSATRAKLFEAAMQAPKDIICIATDGIFSTSPLILDCPKEKILGAWELVEHDEIILVQSGFYYYRNGEKWTAWTRGFDKIPNNDNYQANVRNQIEIILDGWRQKKDEIYFPCTRFITMKSALRGANWWPRWCSWYSLGSSDGMPGRALNLRQSGTKRLLVENYSSKKCKPEEKLIGTIPEANYYPDTLSSKYVLPWEQEEELLAGVPVKIVEEEMEVEN